MGLRTPEQYVEDLKKQRREIYISGEKVEGDWTEHPLIKPVINGDKLIFELAQLNEYQELMTTESDLIGERISRFVQLHTSPDALTNRILANRELQLRHATCHGARCTGTHPINALYATTYDVDKKLGTHYHERFTKWLQNVQRGDLAVNLAAGESKGDRSKRPSEQADPDMYIHIAKRTSDGIVIRGAKAHLSNAAATDYHLVVPYIPMRGGEEDYAIACAVPADSKGIVHIYEWPIGNVARLQPGVDMDLGNPTYGVHGASLVIFDDVFVPYENVFLDGETEFTYGLITAFTNYMALTGTMCKTADVELMAGAAACIAEYNGLAWNKVHHIRDKVVEMVNLAARCRGCAIGACAMSQKHPSGVFLPDALFASAAKLCEVDAISNASTLLINITGGSIATLPSERDLRAPATKKYLEKYLQGSTSVSVENRMRMFRLCEYLSGGSSTIRAASHFTAAAPEVQKVFIATAANIDKLKDYAKKLAKIRE